MLFQMDGNHESITTRKEFATLIDKRGWKRGVEVGAYAGEFSEHLLASSQLEMLYSVDKWRDTGDGDYYPAMPAFRNCQSRLDRFGNRSQMLRMDSQQAASEFEDGSLDFVYLDAGHDFINVLVDLGSWWPKVRRGGFFGGHAYLFMPVEGASVVFLVDTFSALVGQEVFVTGANSSSLHDRHVVAFKASSKLKEFSEEDHQRPFETPSWWIIKS